MNSTKIRKYTLAISILLHLLVLLTYKPLSSIHIFNIIPKTEQFQEKEKQIAFQLVETPEHAKDERPEDPTTLVSDKNTRARNQSTAYDKQLGMPFSDGDLEQIRDIMDIINPTEQQQTDHQIPSNDPTHQSRDQYTATDVYDVAQDHFAKFSRQALLGSESVQEQAFMRPEYKNDQFNVDEIGGLSFNTYEWNYAPYMLAMKRKVERNIFPPPAFTHMGLIDGETIIRFKVYPNGEMKDLEVLQYRGHKSLMETSVQAIKNSNPFNPLPADFPENYLEVTGHFTYFIKR